MPFPKNGDSVRYDKMENSWLWMRCQLLWLISLGVCIYTRNETHITDQGWLKATLQVGSVIRNQLNYEKKDCFWRSLIMAVLKHLLYHFLFPWLYSASKQTTNNFFGVSFRRLLEKIPASMCKVHIHTHRGYSSEIKNTSHHMNCRELWELINHTSQASGGSLEG